MKIFDCFMYFDEDLILDLRLNYLDNFVDKFVIIESKYNHNGDIRKPLFDIKKFEKFEKKIIYHLIDHEPKNLKKIFDNETKEKQTNKKIMNALKRENYQRNFIINGLSEAEDEDWIIISDLDEIPNLELNNIRGTRKRFIFFKQLMIYYKLNLMLENFPWVGSKACKKKDLKSPQWLRNIKDRNYPWWRIDRFFSDTKYSNIEFFNKGGWHFSYVKDPKNIEKKLKSYLHHAEYDQNSLGEKKIEELIKQKKAIYNLKVDSKSNKFMFSNSLVKLDINELPSYVRYNNKKYRDWIENE